MQRPADLRGELQGALWLRQGFLSRVQDALVSGRALASYGRHLRLERYMLANGISLLNNAGLSLLRSLLCFFFPSIYDANVAS